MAVPCRESHISRKIGYKLMAPYEIGGGATFLNF
jgi:hypothetical protein